MRRASSGAVGRPQAPTGLPLLGTRGKLRRSPTTLIAVARIVMTSRHYGLPRPGTRKATSVGPANRPRGWPNSWDQRLDEGWCPMEERQVANVVGDQLDPVGDVLPDPA